MDNGYYSTKKARAADMTIRSTSGKRTAPPRSAWAQAARARSRRTANGLLLRTSKRKWIVFGGFEPGKKARTWIMPAEGGTPKPITPEGIVGSQVTPDGERVLVNDLEGKYFLYPLQGNGSPSAVPQLKADDGVIALAADGHTLFVREA